jgi:curved DNA-binding protein CbpA
MAGRTDPDPDAPDYYGRVGIDRDASQGEVDGAITRAKGHYHPDQSSLDEARASRCFDRVRDAETVLTDPDSRAAYDTFLDRFGPEAGHAEYQEWEESGGPIDPANWERTGTGDTGGQSQPTGTGSTTRRAQGSSTGGTQTDGAATTRQRRSTSRSRQRSSTSSSRRRSTTSRQRGSTNQSESTSRQQASTTTRRGSTDRRQGGSSRSRVERYRGWRGSVWGRVASARERVEEGRLSVFAPVLEWLDRAIDQLVRPGLFVHQYVPRLGQLAAVSALTLGVFLLVGSTDSVLTLLAPLLWVLATIVLYVGGGVVWGIATVATYLFEGYGPALYISVAVLVAVSLYYLLVVFKLDQMADTERG